MSFFGKMFGGKTEKVMTTGEAIQNLRETENMLIKKQEFLEKKIEQEIETAKKNGSKNKRAAIQALKRKKRFMQQLQQIDGTLSTIEMQREALEDANQNTATITTMKKAAEVLKLAHQNLDTDKIHDIMDDIAEQQYVANEISQAISTPIGGYNYDDEELEKELEDLEQEELDKELLSTGGTHELPEVPEIGDIKAPSLPAAAEEKKKAPAKSIEDDDDMKALLSWAN